MSRSNYIDFLRLPQLAQLHVAATMDLSSLVFMSFSSSELKQLVKSVKHKKCVHLEFTLRANRSTLTLWKGSEVEKVAWEWKRLEHGDEMTSENLRLTKKRPHVIHPTCSPIKVREYLEDLFGFPIRLYFFVRKSTRFNLKFVQHIGHILYLAIYREGNIKTKEARRLFNLYGRPIQYVAMQAPGLMFPEGHLLNRSIDLTYMNSTKENMRRFRGSRGFFLDSNCKEEDLIYFVRRWLESGDTNLQEIYVIEGGLVATWNKNIILAQFETTEWDPKLRAGTFINPCKKISVCSNVDFSTGRDILRGDGMLATIKASMGMFYFVVWHNRFPQ